ncbi:HNH endonuclease [Corynebacterium mustelae]|uniref:HNH endonuclease n=2 Tax=Corynebacterium mustelae TaxID=571915 RepID=A0A0G3H0F3_9CORY|nr:HNH endonuclease [Corynebacterium mustelae]
MMAWVNGASRTSTPEWRRLRRHAKKMLPYECDDCGDVPDSEELHLDHVVPHAEGGSDELGNLVWRCASCHAEKTQAEALRGIARRKQRGRVYDPDRERHPGLL